MSHRRENQSLLLYWCEICQTTSDKVELTIKMRILLKLNCHYLSHPSQELVLATKLKRAIAYYASSRLLYDTSYNNNNNRNLIFTVPVSEPKSLTRSKDHRGAWAPVAAEPPDIGGEERSNVVVARGRLVSLAFCVAEEGPSRLDPCFLSERGHLHAIFQRVVAE
eukprot:scaffold26769_cov152-Cylindrotheca_fusiformis.AAC.1